MWLLCAAEIAVAQEPSLAPPQSAEVNDRKWHPQYDLFQLLLEEHEIRTVDDPAPLFNNPSASVFIITSEVGSIPFFQLSRLYDFVQEGGAIVFLCELNSSTRIDSPFRGLGTVYHGPVTSPSFTDRYQDYADCLRITDITDPEDWFPGVKTLITNRGEWFVPSDNPQWRWQTYARYPNSTLPIKSRNQSLISIGKPVTVSADSTAATQGMFLILADSSLLTNGMMWHGDNAKFALRLAELLQRQTRNQLAFLSNGRLLSSATDRLTEQLRREQERQAQNMPMPEPSLEQMLKLGNAIANEVVKSNVLNEALARQPRHVDPRRYFRFLATLLIIAGLSWIVWKLLTSRMLRELWLARRRMRHSYEIVSGNEAGDYRTAAGYLAREFCIQWTGSHQSRDWQRALALLLVRSPAIQPEDKRQLTRIVDIASRGCHEQMAGIQFQQFGRTIATLRNYIAVSV